MISLRVDDVLTQVRTLSSGTLAHLTGKNRYADLEPIQQALVQFVIDRPDQFDNWVEAWSAFQARS